MNKLFLLAAIVLAFSVGIAAVPALAGQPAMTQTPENGVGVTMGRTGQGMMGGGMMGMMADVMGGSMMGNGTMGGGMSDGSMMDRGIMNGGRPNSQWRGPQSGSQGMPD